jgi:hypothetical protein
MLAAWHLAHLRVGGQPWQRWLPEWFPVVAAASRSNHARLLADHCAGFQQEERDFSSLAGVRSR